MQAARHVLYYLYVTRRTDEDMASCKRLERGPATDRVHVLQSQEHAQSLYDFPDWQ